MSGKKTEVSEEFIQSQVEQQILEQCELHGWAIAVHCSSPVEILILLEEDDDDITNYLATENNVTKGETSP